MTNPATPERILAEIRSVINLKGKHVLEIGCGEGERSVEIAPWCEILTAVDSDAEKLKSVQAAGLSNVVFRREDADALTMLSNTVDIVIFTLTIEEVSADKMKRVIDEALRVVKRDGFIVFVEPRGEPFGVKGDDAHSRAYRAITSHAKMTMYKEVPLEKWWIGIYWKG